MHLRFCLFVYCDDQRHSKRGVCTAPMGGVEQLQRNVEEVFSLMRNHHW